MNTTAMAATQREAGMEASKPNLTEAGQPFNRHMPFSFAEQHQVILDGNMVLHRGTLSASIILELQRFLGQHFLVQQFELQEIDKAEFNRRLTQEYQSGDGAAQRAVDDLGAEMDLSQIAADLQQHTDLLAGDDDAPVIRLINAILTQAVREKASDIHLEPYEDRVAVRFRIDGVLAEILSPKAELASVLVSRLKVMAKLDIAEKRLPQDGRISVRLAGHSVDIRVSTIPSVHGERVVLRLLDQAAGQLQLAQLAMPEAIYQGFANALVKPHGIILVTGPTGSGKTTTLYTGLTHINDRSRNILTIEDPIEYLLPGIGQTQVNTKVEMTFARGLRAMLRQDPDVVMIGEIRDQETASIAVQASLTGHLVLSTLHTNTAIGAITRLQDMGVEPFLLSSSLEIVMAQRLVRILCEQCKAPHKAIAAECKRLDIHEHDEFFQAIGCEKCNQTGYRGRMAIYELIKVDDTLRQLIHESAGEQVMLNHARQFSASLIADGRRRVLAGETSLEEVLRVAAIN